MVHVERGPGRQVSRLGPVRPGLRPGRKLGVPRETGGPAGTRVFHVERVARPEPGCSTWNGRPGRNRGVPGGTGGPAGPGVFRVERAARPGPGCPTSRPVPGCSAWNGRVARPEPGVPGGTGGPAKTRMSDVERVARPEPGVPGGTGGPAGTGLFRVERAARPGCSTWNGWPGPARVFHVERAGGPAGIGGVPGGPGGPGQDQVVRHATGGGPRCLMWNGVARQDRGCSTWNGRPGRPGVFHVERMAPARTRMSAWNGTRGTGPVVFRCDRNRAAPPGTKAPRRRQGTRTGTRSQP